MQDDLSFLATAIGSLPHEAAEAALDTIFANIPVCPIWPQLPRRGFREQMEIQYSEGLPCVVVDDESKRMYFDTADEDGSAVAMGEFYEAYMMAEETGDWSSFAISEDFSAGIPGLEKRLQGGPVPYVKVQTTGPISIGLSIVDENKRSIYYNEAFRDIVVKGTIAKSRWQIQKFSPYAEKKVICFIDEPILSAFGSSTYVSVVREDVVAILNELVESIHDAGALCGVHCCGNTEWPILMDAGVDIINFDAFEFGETMALYPEQVKAFLDRGGYLAWGVVPTSSKIRENDEETLMGVYDSDVEALVSQGVDKALLHARSIITPSCGTGSLPVEEAVHVFEILKRTAQALKARG